MMRRLANAVARLLRWRIVGDVPRPQCVLIGAPHTSNWDFLYAMLTFWSLDLNCRWIGKHTLFKGPAGAIMRGLGGIALNRSTTRDFVPEVVSWFEREPELVLAIAPEGTRSRKDYWHTGFYWIAHGAGVPIALGFLDYDNRTVGIGDTLVPTGDIEADLATIRDFYADKSGKHPANSSPVRIRGATETGVGSV